MYIHEYGMILKTIIAGLRDAGTEKSCRSIPAG